MDFIQERKNKIQAYLTNMFSLLAMGASFQWKLKYDRQDYDLYSFEREVIRLATPQQIEMAINSGYRFSFLHQFIYEYDYEPVVKGIQEKMKQPLSLEKLAANVLRTRLRPNAFVGVQNLGLPPGYNKSFITLGVCGEDACTQCTNWCTWTRY